MASTSLRSRAERTDVLRAPRTREARPRAPTRRSRPATRGDRRHAREQDAAASKAAERHAARARWLARCRQTASQVDRTRGPDAKPSPPAATGSSCTEQHEATTVRSSFPRNSAREGEVDHGQRKHRQRQRGDRPCQRKGRDASHRTRRPAPARPRAPRPRPSRRANGNPTRSRRTRRTRTSPREHRGSYDRRRAPSAGTRAPAPRRRRARTSPRAESVSPAQVAPRSRAPNRSAVRPSARCARRGRTANTRRDPRRAATAPRARGDCPRSKPGGAACRPQGPGRESRRRSVTSLRIVRRNQAELGRPARGRPGPPMIERARSSSR